MINGIAFSRKRNYRKKLGDTPSLSTKKLKCTILSLEVGVFVSRTSRTFSWLEFLSGKTTLRLPRPQSLNSISWFKVGVLSSSADGKRQKSSVHVSFGVITTV